MVEETYISRVFEELKLRYDRISVVTNQQRLKRQLMVELPDVEFLPNSALPPSIDEAQIAFKDYNCAIFTAFRGEYTLEQNLERNARLKADMVACGLQYRPVNGCYREADWEVANVEYCFFIYSGKDDHNHKEFFRKAYRLSEKYDQDSFLYKRSGVNKAAFLIATNDSARKEFCSDIKFVGVLYLRVPDVDAWTDCSDGRIAFLQKGLIVKGTGCKNLKFGEGNIFDIEGYNPDGLVVIRKKETDKKVESEWNASCKSTKVKLKIAQHTFINENQTAETIHASLVKALNELNKHKCKRIGVHCSASINGSSVEAAKVAFDTIKEWVKRNDKKYEWIVIVDTYGDYCKVTNDKKDRLL